MSDSETPPARKRARLRGTLDLSSEDITSMDDDAVAALLQEALEEATDAQQKLRDDELLVDIDPLDELDEALDVESVDGESLDDDAEPVMTDEEFEEISVDLLGETGPGEDIGRDAGALLGASEDPDLAFPDHLYGGEPDAAATTATVEPAIPVELLEELEALRGRVDELEEAAGVAQLDMRALSDDNETLRSQSEVYKARLLKLNEEFESYRRRVERDRAEIVRREAERVLRAFLPVLDHMELALQHARANPSGSGLLEGVELILAQFYKTFEDLQVAAIGATEGQRFDPNLHDAVMREQADGIDPNHISRVLRTGYLFGDRLLRAARVAVAEGEEAPRPSCDDGDRPSSAGEEPPGTDDEPAPADREPPSADEAQAPADEQPPPADAPPTPVSLDDTGDDTASDPATDDGTPAEPPLGPIGDEGPDESGDREEEKD